MIDTVAVKKFTLEVEAIAAKEEMNYIEAIVFFCEEKDLDIEAVIPFVKANQQLKDKLYENASALHLIPKISQLPME